MKVKLIFLLFILSFQLRAQELDEKIDSYIKSYVNTSDFSGVVRIVKADTVIFDKAYGKANQSFHISNTLNTRFKIGSISKQFTAAAILKLEEQGLLDIEDDLSMYFPSYPNASGIKIKHLLTHTSGLIDLFSIPSFQKIQTNKTSLSKLTGLLLSEKPRFKAGTKYEYSNGGYAVLAQLIEQLSHQSYAIFLNENIFKPLGMRRTGHSSSQDIVPNLAIGYDPKGYDGLKQADFVEHDLLKGSGSLYSTVGDLSIWVSTLKNRIYFSKAFYEEFFKDYGYNYGTGISLYTSYKQRVFGHDGRINGYMSDYLHYNDDDITIIILGNLQTGVADFFRNDLAAIVFNEDYKSRAKTIPLAKQYPTNLKQYRGAYSFGPNFTVFIEKINGVLKARANEGAYCELVPLENTKFFSRTLYATVEFVSVEGEGMKMMWTNNDGDTFEGVRQIKKAQ
ncbi:serine hydrolase domain-containing protein [Sediminitomix flava]|uniref:CubicO group peptidase (Beta-lactamase class C family) n=1 Tax=Sediminitomix flava TaxID=379075 RepID=A0A315ZDW5_SEDFL|nr:serine hydrolase domain-containing protein [Sediminitomix flava]PWJ43731.1 CubicO group peptidase (beta-lactamase class C family) [Sediminitomix flava]